MSTASVTTSMFSSSSSTLAGTGPAPRISNSTAAMFSTPRPDDHVPFTRRSHLTGAAGSSEPGGNRDPSPCPDCPYPWAALGAPGTLRGVVSAAEKGEPSMGDQVPGRLRLRRRRRLFLRVRAPSSAADRGCSRPGDPGQRRSRLRVLGASRRGAVAGRVGRSCWGTPKHVRPEHLWRWTRPTTTCRRAGSWCWAR